MRRLACLAASVLAGCSAHPPPPPPPEVAASAQFAVSGDWPSYGRDLAGTRYSPLKQINANNVGDLRQAWSFPLEARGADAPAGPWELTPLVVGGTLYAAAAGRIVALKADTGEEIWQQVFPAGAGVPRRGLAYWPGERGQAARVFALIGRRLVALDAGNGRKLPSFGVDGEVEVPVSFHAAPVLFEDRLFIGSTTGPGSVRAYDVRTGAQLWVFAATPGGEEGTNAVHAVSSFTVDVDRALLYVGFASAASEPKSTAAPDHPLGSAVVALDARTGAKRWQYQLVHHDLWGFDVTAPPTLVEVPASDGTRVAALALAARTGYVYLLNRATGEPLAGIAETPVAKSEVPGEQSAPTQPIPAKPPPIARVAYAAEDIVGAMDTSDEHANYCRELRDRAGGLANLGPFTPFRYRAPGTDAHSTVVFPGAGGGAGWGGAAADTTLGYVFANVTNVGTAGWIEPNTADTTAAQTGEGPRRDRLPYRRASAGGDSPLFVWTRPGGEVWPCQKPPWGQLVAVNTTSGEIAWQVPLGVTADLGEARQHTGRPNAGGPIATAGGLVFVGAADDRRLRAFDSRTGEELWSAPLPGPGQAVPVAYLGRNGKQYIAIVATAAAAADSQARERSALIAFSLP